jgi:hypothetical protein
MEELLQGCKPFDPDAVVREVDRLSRTERVRLVYKKDGSYGVRLTPTV